MGIRYEHKHRYYDAERWFPGKNVLGVQFPIPEEYRKWPDLDPTTQAMVVTPEGHEKVNPGDWIVSDEHRYGCLAFQVFSPHAFSKSFVAQTRDFIVRVTRNQPDENGSTVTTLGPFDDDTAREILADIRLAPPVIAARICKIKNPRGERMTVAELIAELQRHDPKLCVVVHCFDYEAPILPRDIWELPATVAFPDGCLTVYSNESGTGPIVQDGYVD